MDLSILIVNWNTRDLLERCLKAVAAATQRLGAEILVVDNGSSDGSAELVRGSFPDVVLITNDRNRGFAAANNQALARATGDFVLLLNTDAVLTGDALVALRAALERRPELGGSVPLLVNPDGRVQTGYHRRRTTGVRLIGNFLHNGHLWRNNPWVRSYLRLDAAPDAEQPVEQPAATCWLLRRSAIAAAGGLFDERFPIHFNDADLAERLLAVGKRTLLVPGARVVHDGGASVNRLDHYLLKELYFVSQLLFLRKHRSFIEYLAVKGFLAVASLGLLTLTRLGLTHHYFGEPITDRSAAVTAQFRILRSLIADRLRGF